MYFEIAGLEISQYCRRKKPFSELYILSSTKFDGAFFFLFLLKGRTYYWMDIKRYSVFVKKINVGFIIMRCGNGGMDPW